jgi:hypothetical protein
MMRGGDEEELTRGELKAKTLDLLAFVHWLQREHLPERMHPPLSEEAQRGWVTAMAWLDMAALEFTGAVHVPDYHEFLGLNETEETGA